MKKYLLSALALPLLFACSSEDYLDQKATDNDQFAGIEKVDATFSMADSPSMRMATKWQLEPGDQYGFAWLTDAHEEDPAYTAKVPITGNAFQNHPLTQTGDIFKPQTSIYVGKYFLYRPYDKSVVSPAEINFSLAEQKLANDASEKHNGAPYQALAASAIIIGDKWTEVKPGGTVIDEEIWNEPGIDNQFKIYAALFSNRTALDLTYKNNNPKFAKATTITGATDINFTIAKDETVGAADITKVTVDLKNGVTSSTNNVFTYAPSTEDKEPVIADGVLGDDHDGEFWADKSNVSATYGFKFKDGTGVITLTPDAGKVVETGEEGSKGWFWFNSLPVTNGNAALTDKVVTTYNTSYGTVTIDDKDGNDTEVTLQNVAYAREVPSTGTAKEWIKFAAADDETQATDKKVWDITAAAHNTFVNQYGNHVGKYAITVDFSKGVMNDMHITDDAHLQKALKYYIASGKTENVSLNLDEDEDGNFKISKISIALLQTINKTTEYVKVHACATHGTPKIIVTQDGQTGDLATKTEVPALNKVFDVATEVYLASATNWTWSNATALPIDAGVASITNEGNLTVNANNVALSNLDVKIYNAKGAKMDITQVTTVKNTLHNYGTINIGSETKTSAELRAYGKWIVNQPTSLTDCGVINNYGVIGSTSGTGGQVHNYGLINMMNEKAMTLLKSNEKGTNPFGTSFDKSLNKMGTVVLPKGKPYAIVSVDNAAENGFIKYEWDDDEYTHDPGNVKYNTIIVSKDIEFKGTDPATEIQYIEFNGDRTMVVNPAASNKLTELKGIIVNEGKSIIIEKNNIINCSVGAWLDEGATVYKGGTFTYPAGATTNYFGTWSTDQVVVYGD